MTPHLVSFDLRGTPPATGCGVPREIKNYRSFFNLAGIRGQDGTWTHSHYVQKGALCSTSHSRVTKMLINLLLIIVDSEQHTLQASNRCCLKSSFLVVIVSLLSSSIFFFGTACEGSVTHPLLFLSEQSLSRCTKPIHLSLYFCCVAAP